MPNAFNLFTSPEPNMIETEQDFYLISQIVNNSLKFKNFYKY